MHSKKSSKLLTSSKLDFGYIRPLRVQLANELEVSDKKPRAKTCVIKAPTPNSDILKAKFKHILTDIANADAAETTNIFNFSEPNVINRGRDFNILKIPTINLVNGG